ncbi:MAG: YicC/YloC family endoribonuclease [Magnetovibrionaceae bacterium]
MAAKKKSESKAKACLRSMTGFARIGGQAAGASWEWEVRSVNGKARDIRLRLPSGFEGLDAKVRGLLADRLARGNITANLNLTVGSGQPKLAVNADALAQVLTMAPRIREALPETEAPSLHGLLGLKGILEMVDDVLSDEDRADVEAGILATLAEALDHLVANREAEGARMGEVLDEQMNHLEALSEEAGRLAALRPEKVRERLKTQIDDILNQNPPLDPDRLAQEVAILLVKGDVREELDRLTAHVAAARDLLKGEGAVGRRLDFLCQEFNREANTLCSKSQDVELTRIGLDLKATIEQFREQVQNIE